MGTFIIVGAGPVGSGTALRLAEAGHRVVVATRSGGGPDHPSVERVVADATNSNAIAKLAVGAEALLNCVNPRYTKWETDWPPLAAALLDAAERTGAGLVTMSNLYGHGPTHQTMRADTPLDAVGKKGRVRAAMWLDAKAAHDAGRVRATEVRASDFFGPGVTDSNMGERVVPRVLQGKGVQLLESADVPHSFSYMPDVTATLTAAATSSLAWGRPWLVPSPTLTQRELVRSFCVAAGVDPLKVSTIPGWVLRAAGVVIPLLRELQEVQYQFAAPFMVDAAETTEVLKVRATEIELAAADTIAWWRTRPTR